MYPDITDTVTIPSLAKPFGDWPIMNKQHTWPPSEDVHGDKICHHRNGHGDKIVTTKRHHQNGPGDKFVTTNFTIKSVFRHNLGGESTKYAWWSFMWHNCSCFLFVFYKEKTSQNSSPRFVTRCAALVSALGSFGGIVVCIRFQESVRGLCEYGQGHLLSKDVGSFPELAIFNMLWGETHIQHIRNIKLMCHETDRNQWIGTRTSRCWKQFVSNSPRGTKFFALGSQSETSFDWNAIHIILRGIIGGQRSRWKPLHVF